ncbi:hypothetical protein HYG86_11025 [Alkalicella caledoniensis]|uniref:N-acetyltransferase domain-containing protein n=1 Tax=Alkalicella caledoniensis TaxID=2731377 RepID=A0A7G9W994_ALKCA|nr:hypothetical protein [Alkalicella caledoniensis]QNO15256.1 hypothetical protein HYG86_11025 [Alkalicella caledoniensis]
MIFNYVIGNEELLEDIYPIVELAVSKDFVKIKEELKEKALWGSMRIVMAQSQQEEIMGVGLATVNNQNTGHVDYLFIKNPVENRNLKDEIQEELVKWLKWLKVKSVTIDPQEHSY